MGVEMGKNNYRASWFHEQGLLKRVEILTFGTTNLRLH